MMLKTKNSSENMGELFDCRSIEVYGKKSSKKLKSFICRDGKNVLLYVTIDAK
jgi:hypothetical protein